ncbi:MKRN2 opposite strand, tandem duplicate 1 [Dunckerocampus dactyliophorus]|uniref:MKRN2 opposite strand, tandem duplicate 1 n=1 Tax=Dunckerocampus dactyliophorus TaxID=161453 RepID=UPI002404C744|nr:MKRN2 opposite strand, tandem duplicate 1 [Dunckerocampus dactyliophorus]
MELGDLLRFTHCGNTVFTSADEAGLRCPVCGQAVRFALSEAPVRIQCPIRDGHRASCCFLVTSQSGAIGLSEEKESELHVGICNSEGLVFSYTELGVQCQQQGWEQSIIIPLVAPSNCIPDFKRRWDAQLEVFAALDTWTPDRFQEEREFGSCCYGFALGFINQVMMSQGKQPISRECFTSEYVLPRIESATRYLSVFQHVCRHGYHCTGQRSDWNSHVSWGP